MDSCNKCLVFLIYLFIQVFLAPIVRIEASIQIPPPSVYSSKIWYDGKQNAALPQALLRKKIKYAFVQTSNQIKLDLNFDFETALYAWLISLGLNDVKVELTKSIDNADLVFHFGPERYRNLGFNPCAIHYRTDDIVKGKIVSVVDINSQCGSGYSWASLRDLVDGSPKEAAYNLIKSKKRIQHAMVENKDRSFSMILYWTILHELGHVFGLGDRYSRNGVRVSKKEDTVMGNDRYLPFYPTPLDVDRVKKHMRRYFSCEGYLIHRRVTFHKAHSADSRGYQ